MCYINYEIKYSAVGMLHPNTKRSCNSRYLFDDDNPSAVLFFQIRLYSIVYDFPYMG